MNIQYTRKHEKRFWERVNKSADPNACWPWTAAKTKDGYGHFRDGSRTVYAHRYSYQLAHGPIPQGQCICHRCDTPPCCNPAHLFAGSVADNMADRDAKGRKKGGKQHRVFTPDQAADIRKWYASGTMTLRAIASRMGVSHTTIKFIVKNKTYRDTQLEVNNAE